MQQITVLQTDYLHEVIARVFRRKEVTLSDEGARYERDDYEATLRYYRTQMRHILETLPESAFYPQPPDDDGAEVWSAGQIAAHLLEAAVEVGIKDMRQFLGLPAVETAYERLPLPEGRICSRAEALAILDSADDDLDAFFAGLPRDADLAASGVSKFFGPISVGGYLLAWCFHESHHCRQAAELA